MRRASSVDAATSPSTALHPALQAALSSLDVQLEVELTRYRRQRHLQVRRQRDAKPMNLIAVAATGGRTQPQTAPPSPPSVPIPEGDPWQGEAPAALALHAIAEPQSPVHEATAGMEAAPAADPWMASIAPDPVTVLQPDSPGGNQEPDDYLASSEELLRSLAEEEADLRRRRQTHLQERILTPLGIGSLLLLLLSSATLGYLVLNPGTVQGWRLDRFWNPRSVEPAAVAPSESIAPSGTASPDLAPNLASEEFRDLNLDTLSTLPSNPPTQLPSPTASPSVAALSPAAPPSAAIPPASSPTASSDIPTTRPQTAPARPAATPRAIAVPSPARVTPPQPRVTVSRRPAASAPAAATRPAQRSSQASRSAPRPPQASRPAPRPPQASRPAQPAPRRAAAAQPARPAPAQPRRSSAAQPAPRPATPAPIPTAARPTTPTRYYVTSDYSGDRSLEQAQRVVGDAYVRNFPNGARVQLGAFSDADHARQLSEQLQQQGISAQVQQHSGGNE